jgi:sensor histidine kinase YesM
MEPAFFPRNRQFWLYHGSVISLISLIQIVFVVWSMPADGVLFNLVGWALLIVFYTLSMLAFRQIYIRRQWKNLNTFKTIVISTLCGGISGVLVAAITLSITFLLFWNSIFTPDFHEKAQISIPKAIAITFVVNWLQITLFSCLWIYIYIGIITNRRIREAEIANLRLQSNLKEAQLNSLSNQLNPHFLFNALNNIRFMIHEDGQRADRMITSLSDILRYSLASSRQEKVLLSQEVEIINRYIAIAQSQLEQRLVFELNIPDTHMDYLIPPMILQMLVENAVKHGLDNIRLGGELLVESEVVDHQLNIVVTNDLAQDYSSGRNSMGIGLKNIQQRLQLIYGSKGSFTSDKTESQFRAVISIPAEIA